MAAQILTLFKILQDGLPINQHQTERITTTNFIFRLHSKYASTILIVTSVLLFIQQLFIDHLKCFRPLQEGTALESAVLNQYCYATGTYALLNDTISKEGYWEDMVSKHPNSKYYFHHYFQWVPLILFLQGMAFCIPQLIWQKFIENGRLEAFCNFPIKPQPLIPSDSGEPKEPETQPIADLEAIIAPTTTTRVGISFSQTLESLQNRKYFYGFLFTEVLNLLVVIFIFIMCDWLLQGNFRNLGPSWIHYLNVLKTFKSPPSNPDETVTFEDSNFYSSKNDFSISNPLELAFPTLFNCEWTKPAPLQSSSSASSDIRPLTYSNIKCVMGLNLIHQRIFLVFWFIYVLLITVNLLNIIHRILFCSSFKVRKSLVKTQALRKGQRGFTGLTEVLTKIKYYDCFILSRILTNIDLDKFEYILEDCKQQLGNFESNRQISSEEVKHVEVELKPMNVS